MKWITRERPKIDRIAWSELDNRTRACGAEASLRRQIETQAEP